MDAIQQEARHGAGLAPGGSEEMQEWSALDWDALPRGLREIKDLIGPGAALILAEEYGGGQLYVPCRIRESHPLVQLIGHEKVQRLSLAYGGDKLHVPKVDAIERQFRRRRILSLRQTGRSIASLAREFNLTCRRVRQICSA
ncbi:Mor transcription activator family protein [Oceanidesulfovibrio marinus]|uniref:Mor transcription activator domain-containing protein n=1 Tax=Oceanidesulfovibrio marinus TaxID=370038 RepID=A0A6P1ZJ74_9BACT|nr:Mor transcription activator family protein [Oceanidesulfovibrio marinus]TVM34632.1 hypothetical protein DQK91_08655 [Oceanidesulfovibrio marinus]